jgi:flagellar hook-associated protein 1
MGLFGLLSVARDGMTAQSAALATTGANVANVATPGYARRTAILESATDGNGGVRYTRTERSFDRFAYAHVVGEQSKYGAADARSSALTEIETTLAPPSNSIGDQATSLIRSFNALAGFATDPSLREDVIARADNLATTLQNTRASLEATSANILGRAGDTVNDLNAQLGRIADLNRQIAAATGVGGDSAGLRDQRDLAVRDVGDRIGARAIEDKTGRVTLFAAGAVLVEGDSAKELSMDLDTNGGMRFFVTGAAKTEITSRIDGGTLGGLREARDVDLKKAIADVDAYAFDVANAFNTVHATGFGSDGGTGRALFTISATQAGAAATLTVNAALVGHPERVGAADSAGSLPGGNAIALKLANLADTQVFGGKTLADRFASIVTDVGFRKNNADAELELRTDTLAVAESLSDSANGVSLDEEMVNLSQYQRAFEASSRILRAADELLQTLMESF